MSELGDVSLRCPNSDYAMRTIFLHKLSINGRFNNLLLSDSFMLSDVAGQKSRTVCLGVTLAGPNESVLSGSVAGLLVAASPAQVIVGSILPDGHKEAKANYVEPSSAPLQLNPGGAAGASSSSSRGTLSESSGGPASPLNLSSGACNNISQGMLGMPCPPIKEFM
ncbi:hypothetical protein Pfo_021842 [Paulownia fortunei]|nr:hypothetical protein Pfo_021842 [Paulownia fortunei]